MRSSRKYPVLVAALLAFGAAVLSASPAAAATTTRWASWSGSPNSFTVQVADTPALTASVSTDSRTGQTGVISGASTWLAAGTPVGAVYGSSQGRPYLNLRPRADTATTPSTTTYTFNHPTPTSGWTFVLGDIDSDMVKVEAIGPDGIPLTAPELGYRGGFNYCAPGLAGKPSCTGSATDIPTWDPANGTLTGNAAAADTSGSAAWFEPDAPISALTFVFTRRAGLPVYQTWFASLARDITGTLSAPTGDLGGATLTLRDSDGDVVGTTATSADGAYSFPGVQASDGYTVSITPPSGRIVVGSVAKPADLSAEDAVVDFAMRDIVPVAIGGTVRDTDGNPVPGASVQLDGGGASVTTGPDGTYLFDTVAVGAHQVGVVAPTGYSVVTGPQTVTVPPATETPITDVDFVVRQAPRLTGRVTDPAGGVGGVVISAVRAGGGTVGAVTEPDGAYTLPALAAGDYTVTVEAPDGYVVSGTGSRSVTVSTSDVSGVDFALAVTGSVSGAVTAGGSPIRGATVVVDGPDGPTALTTGADGTYGLEGLTAGDYTATISVPDGFALDGPGSRSFTITDAGETVGGEDFTLVAVVKAPSTTTGTAGSGTAELADTGIGSPLPTALAALGALAAGGILLAMTVKRRRALRRGAR